MNNTQANFVASAHDDMALVIRKLEGKKIEVQLRKFELEIRCEQALRSGEIFTAVQIAKIGAIRDSLDIIEQEIDEKIAFYSQGLMQVKALITYEVH